MMITRSGRVVNNKGGPAPQNVGARAAQLPTDEVQLIMYNMIDQKKHEFMELLTQGLPNTRGGVSVVNEPIIDKQVNN